MQRELGSTKRMLKAVLFQTGCAWILGTIVYQIGSRIEDGSINLVNLLIILAIAVLVIFIIMNQIKKNKKGCSSCPYCNSCK
jgi:hypothetical protein